MTKYVVGTWSVRRFRAWRRGLMQPMWLVIFAFVPSSGRCANSQIVWNNCSNFKTIVFFWKVVVQQN